MMRQPDSLGAAGRNAWKRAIRGLRDVDDPDLFYDAASRLAHAVDLADRARRAWRKAGEPLVKESGSAVHPLVVVMQDADQAAARHARGLEQLKRAAGNGRPGRNPVAKMALDIGEPPSAKLRRLK